MLAYIPYMDPMGDAVIDMQMNLTYTEYSFDIFLDTDDINHCYYKCHRR